MTRRLVYTELCLMMYFNFVNVYISAGVEDQKHYDAYESALKGGLVLNMHYLKFLFFGPPRTGKSTARRRLVHELVNISSCSELSPSTCVAETNEIIIKKLTIEPAAIANFKWWSMRRSNKLDVCSDKHWEYLAQLFYTLIKKRKDQQTTETLSQPDHDTSEPVSDVHQNQSDKSDDNRDTGITVPNLPLKSPGLQHQLSRNLNTEMPDKSSLLPPSDSGKKAAMNIDEAFKKLTTVLQAESPEELHKLLEELIMLNMVDIGGQPAFLELCPAFSIGPTLYFIFFRLDQDLKTNYPVKFQASDGKETVLESSYCPETVLHQCLSSIACFSSQVNVPGRALIFGTYKDKVDKERISQLDTMLQQQLECTELYKNHLLLQASTGTLFYSLDNMTGSDSEMSPIREDIVNIIKNYFPPIPIPASWLMFRVVLHFLHKPVVSISECEMIANRLSMNSSVQDAIWFFHHNVGSLMHYPDIPSMKDLVICDVQVVFDSTSELIIDTFKFSNRDIPQTAVKDFLKKGQFYLAHIMDKTESHRENQLSLKQLVDLLKNRNIIAEIESDHEYSAQSNPKFVMPAVLKEASEELLKLVNSKQEASSLNIHFKSGFVPFGVFCASIANLIARQHSMSPSWRLCDEQMMKNKVKFCIDKSFIATLISRPQSLEIQVEKSYPNAKYNHSLSTICSTVQLEIVRTLKTVISKMKYKSFVDVDTDQPFNLAFQCNLDDSHSSHLMIVDETSYCGECLKLRIACVLNKKHLMWFSQVRIYIYMHLTSLVLLFKLYCAD